MNAAPDMLMAGLKMIAALGAVLALIFLLLHGVRKFSGGRLGGFGAKHIQVLERCPLGVKKSIALVRVPGKVLVLGVCTDRITLLDALDETLAKTVAAPEAKTPFGPVLGKALEASEKDEGEGA